jgi:hypothetical protein
MVRRRIVSLQIVNAEVICGGDGEVGQSGRVGGLSPSLSAVVTGQEGNGDFGWRFMSRLLFEVQVKVPRPTKIVERNFKSRTLQRAKDAAPAEKSRQDAGVTKTKAGPSSAMRRPLSG